MPKSLYTVTGTRAQLARFNAMSVASKAGIRRASRETANAIRDDAKKFAPVALGKLRASIKVVKDGDTYTVVVGVPYGAYVEYGTRPHHPPGKNLSPWASKVLGDANAGYSVAYTIADFGTPAQPFLRPAVERNKSTLSKKIKTVLRVVSEL
jgi:HK97 gp10 family phage protein